MTKSYGERLRGCNQQNMNPVKAQELSPELQAALGPLLGAIESLSERIVEYNERIEQIAKQSYPDRRHSHGRPFHALSLQSGILSRNGDISPTTAPNVGNW